MQNKCVTIQKLSTSSNDSHIIKNTEWGAVAYLAQSKYGRNGTEISRSECLGYYTGTGSAIGENKIYNGELYSWNNIKDEQKYNGKIGKLASTTGNIYGIYDMSGGAYEYVMGVYGTENNPQKGNSGFTTFPESKYYDLYTKTSLDINKIGDALYETKDWNRTTLEISFSTKSPFILRSGAADTGYVLGSIFFFMVSNGGQREDGGFNIAITTE